jgi:LAO/AO transport system kinase
MSDAQQLSGKVSGESASEQSASEQSASEQNAGEPLGVPGEPRLDPNGLAARTLAAAVIAGETRAAARACRLVDEGWPGHAELLAALYPRAASGWTIGVTGSPGVGKSTLTSRLVQHFRAQGSRVAVVAVDPTSPFSGGAILGDRIRMQAHWADAEVFVRSVATRGAHGGLSRTAADVARVLAAWGAGIVLIETVGVGQDELDVMRVADTTLVIQAPGAGDDIQAAKAGLLECADVFAVNKADLAGAENVVENLRAMLALGHVTASAPSARGGHSAAGQIGALEPHSNEGRADGDWDVAVVSCVATSDEGMAQVVERLEGHRAWLATPPGQARRRERSKEELIARVREALSATLIERHRTELDEIAERVARRELDPYAATRLLVDGWT